MIIYKNYLRFCASVNFFFERIRKDDDPGVLALLFVTVLLSVYTYGVFYSVELLAGKKINIHSFFFYGVLIFWGVFNYFFAFRKEQLYRHYKDKFNLWQSLLIILLGYAFMFITGYFCQKL